MIEIKILVNRKNFSLYIAGHAAYNPGNDIVCASCSAISQTFIRLLEEMGYSDIQTDKGIVKVKGQLNDDVKQFVKFIATGYSGLANTYPDNVSLDVIDKDNVLT